MTKNSSEVTGDFAGDTDVTHKVASANNAHTTVEEVLDDFGLENWSGKQEFIATIKQLVLDEVIGRDIKSVIGHPMPGHPVNIRLSEQRQAPEKVMVGKQ